MLDKIVTAGAELKSFRLAARMLAKLAEVTISERHVGRLTLTLGAELQAERDSRAAALPPQTLRDQQPGPAPAVVAVEVDGGRLHTRTADQGPGVHAPHWREDKVACLLTLQSPPRDRDPQPELPACFLERGRVARLVQEISHQRPADAEPLILPAAAPAVDTPIPPTGAAPETDTPAVPPVGTTDARPHAGSATARWQPQRLVRTCVATLRNSDAFGKLVAAEADQRHFYAALRRAFVADGQHYNWVLQ